MRLHATLLAALLGTIALGMVLTPGPNMIYLASRSIVQGRQAGLISLGGVIAGFVVYLALVWFLSAGIRGVEGRLALPEAR